MVELLTKVSALLALIPFHEQSLPALSDQLKSFHAEASQYRFKMLSLFTGSPQMGPRPEFLRALSGAIDLLSEKIHKGILQTSGNKESIAYKSYLEISEELTETLNLLRYSAPGCFDKNQKVTHSQVHSLEQQLVLTLKSLKRLQKRLDAHTAELIPLLQKLLEENIQYGITYQQYDYRVILLSMLSRLENVRSANYNYLIHHQLIQFNFNHPDYIVFCNDKLAEKFHALDADSKVQEYRKYEMNVSQVLPAQHIGLYSDFPTTKEALLIFLAKELEYLQPSPAIQTEQPKLHTSLTVAEISLLLRSMQIAGYITEPEYSVMVRKASRMLTSRGAEHISESSMSSKGYNVTAETAVSVIDALLKCVSVIRGIKTR